MNDIIYWIWLSLVFGTGCIASDNLLLAHKYNAESIYRADKSDYAGIAKFTPKQLKALLDKDLSEANSIAQYCETEGVGLLPVNSRLYPRRLREIQSKPILLYFKGDLIHLEQYVCIATVGTRSMTDYGRRYAYTLCYDLARCGAVVVSGMALGNDGMCHAGCLDAGGYTVAVLGCGIDRTYPSEHFELMNRIIAQGLVLTEYKPFTPPKGWNFPVRNRIISGLSQGTLVIEADLNSGALITATHALKQGRDIFAVPGKIGEHNSEGTNKLIQDGANIIMNAADILEMYEGLYGDTISILEYTRGKLNPRNLQYSLKYTSSSNNQPRQHGNMNKHAEYGGRINNNRSVDYIQWRPPANFPPATGYNQHNEYSHIPYNAQPPHDNVYRVRNPQYNKTNQQHREQPRYNNSNPPYDEKPQINKNNNYDNNSLSDESNDNKSIINRLFGKTNEESFAKGNRPSKRGSGDKISEKSSPRADEVISDDLSSKAMTELTTQESEAVNKEPITLTENERLVYDILSLTEQRTTDYIIKAGIKPSVAMAALTFLETKGAVKSLPGGNYVKLPLD